MLAKSLKFVITATVAVGAVIAIGQTSSQVTPTRATKEIEDVIAKKVNDVRASAGREPLKRTNPSREQLQLVCTAATGRQVSDPDSGGLRIYETPDPAIDTEPLKDVATGKEYSNKRWSRFSVVVEIKRGSTENRPIYTVGIMRRVSAVAEFFSPLGSDIPFAGMNEWKKQVAPECKNVQPAR